MRKKGRNKEKGSKSAKWCGFNLLNKTQRTKIQNVKKWGERGMIQLKIRKEKEKNIFFLR